MSLKELREIEARLREAIDALPEKDALGNITQTGKKVLKQINELREEYGRKLDELQPSKPVARVVEEPRAFFDPANPKLFGMFAALALVGQERYALGSIGDRPFYGSGVYAIYYRGAFEPYQPISGTEHPIYVGKADPAEAGARTARQQGESLGIRLKDHRDSIACATSSLDLGDFECRFLVVASGWQTAAESALIRLFRPVWNKETRVLLGFGKHGDNSKTRQHPPSAWDTMHPGRPWAVHGEVENPNTPESLTIRVAAHFAAHPVVDDASIILHNLLESVGTLE